MLRCRRALTVLAVLAAACSPGGRPAPANGGRPDVILVIVDTAHAGHFSADGYPRATTPELARLAAEGERYTEAWAQAPWTLPSIASILTGQPPYVHGAGRRHDRLFGLQPDVTTLAERLLAAGYRTGAIINVIWCNPKLSGLDRGFESYDFHSSDESNVGGRDAAATTDAAIAWLDASDGRPSFLVVHYFDPHLTYDPPAPFDTMFAPTDATPVPVGFGSASQVFDIRSGQLPLDAGQRAGLVARYDGELRYTDQQFGRLRAALTERGRWASSVVVVVGDHGEEFWEHGGFEHGHSHHREVLRVPLIVRRPGGPSDWVVDHRVRQIDIAPTILDAVGLEPAGDLPGRPVLLDGDRWAVAEGSLWAGDLVSVRADVGTVFLDRTTGDARYFAPGDRGETEPGPVPQAAHPLLELARSLPVEPPQRAPERALTDEQREQLRAIGYVQ